MNCPSCGSDNTQAVKVLVTAGTRRGSSEGQSVGLGLGLGGGAGVGLGSTQSTSVSMTDLARRFAPPPPPEFPLWPWPFGIMCGGLGVLRWQAEDFGLGACLILGALALFVAGIALAAMHGDSVKKRKSAVAYFNSAWFCHKCGHDWANS